MLCVNWESLMLLGKIFKLNTLSICRSAWYCGISALRGSVKIFINISSLREWKGTTTGKRPTNSGIIPNSIKSLASTSCNILSLSMRSASASPPSLKLFWSASVAALLPCILPVGAPKPRYCNNAITI